MKFTIRSTGAGGEGGGGAVRYVSFTANGDFPWALVSAPLGAMLAGGSGGVAWVEFVLEAGENGWATLLLAPESCDTTLGMCAAAAGARGNGVGCSLADGAVYVDGFCARMSTAGWGAPLHAARP